MTLLVVAGLTLREAVRRRLIIVMLVLTLVVIGLATWGFHAIPTVRDRHGQLLGPALVELVSSQLLIFVMFCFSGVLALSGALVSSPVIANEVESGIALSMLARPVRRSDVVLGKWLGLLPIVVGYSALVTALMCVAVGVTTGYTPPDPAGAGIYLAVEGTVVLTFGLLLSTRLPAMTAGIVAVLAFFVCWIGGIAHGIGVSLENDTVANIGTASQVLFPSDVAWRGALYAMEPSQLLALNAAVGRRVSAANPFLALNGLDAVWIAWLAVWIAVMLALACVSFSRREL